MEISEVVGSEGINLAWDGMLMYMGQPKVRASELLHLIMHQGWDSQLCLESTRQSEEPKVDYIDFLSLVWIFCNWVGE